MCVSVCLCVSVYVSTCVCVCVCVCACYKILYLNELDFNIYFFLFLLTFNIFDSFKTKFSSNANRMLRFFLGVFVSFFKTKQNSKHRMLHINITRVMVKY